MDSCHLPQTTRTAAEGFCSRMENKAILGQVVEEQSSIRPVVDIATRMPGANIATRMEVRKWPGAEDTRSRE